METTVESFAQRYEAILIAYGLSPSDLAKRLNETVAKFYQYRDGVKPRSAVLEKMLANLPDLSPEYLYRGIGPIKLTDRKLTPISGGSELDRLRKENEALRMQNGKLENRVEKQEGQIEKLNEQVVRLSELNFEVSDSRTTTLNQPQYDHNQERLVIAGFVQELPQPEPIKISSPVQVYSSLNILKTLGCVEDHNGTWVVPASQLVLVRS
ncbi:hypothetical protein [Spirosoma luteum]|uniref:hypothetical protein n=1 Tax=Spirosoma luteum TaxID=431553 RepID=UPI00037199BE|nr:hypothetical protein [Spirosoma luteum]